MTLECGACGGPKPDRYYRACPACREQWRKAKSKSSSRTIEEKWLAEYAKIIDRLENECEDWADKNTALRIKCDDQEKLIQQVYDLIVGIQSPFVKRSTQLILDYFGKHNPIQQHIQTIGLSECIKQIKEVMGTEEWKDPTE